MGPDRLLEPERLGREPGGKVVRDELMGRPCWRWTSGDEVRWVDDETGCLLRLDTGDRSAVFTEVVLAGAGRRDVRAG